MEGCSAFVGSLCAQPAATLPRPCPALPCPGLPRADRESAIAPSPLAVHPIAADCWPPLLPAACLPPPLEPILDLETVYGLGANALREESVLNIFRYKGRPLNGAAPSLAPLAEHLRSQARFTPPNTFSCGPLQSGPGPAQPPLCGNRSKVRPCRLTLLTAVDCCCAQSVMHLSCDGPSHVIRRCGQTL